MTAIWCIVEGHGEIDALTELVRRIAAEVSPTKYIHILGKTRDSRSSLLRPNELERVVTQAGNRLGGRGGILIQMDADNDCAATLGPDLQRRAEGARPDLTIGVVLAVREYEAWFLAAAESLRGIDIFPDSITAPPNPEGIRDAKGWLKRQSSGKYEPPLHQAILTKRFDLTLARSRSRSFDKCYRVIERLIHAVSKSA